MAPRYPRPKRPTPNFDPGSTSVVRNVANTGQMSSSKQTTGATGAATNRVTSVTKRGADGAPGSTRSTTVVSGSQVAQTQDAGTSTALSQSAQAQANAAVAEARARAQAQASQGQTDATGAISGALDNIGSRLSSARQQALDAVRKANAGADFESRVNQAFDEADKQVQNAKKRRS